MPHARTYEPSIPKAHLLDELEDLHAELDQRNAELDNERAEHRAWKSIALALAGCIRERRASIAVSEIDLVELNTTFAIR
jgi:hypothetical protein